jgi:hypothetical protein
LRTTAASRAAALDGREIERKLRRHFEDRLGRVPIGFHGQHESCGELSFHAMTSLSSREKGLDFLIANASRLYTFTLAFLIAL